jgi:glycogen operon protein
MTDREWFDPAQRSLGMILNGDEIPDRDPRGERIRGDTLMVLLHSGEGAIEWLVPQGWGERWTVVVDTGEPVNRTEGRRVRAGEVIGMQGRSLVVLRVVHDVSHQAGRRRTAP